MRRKAIILCLFAIIVLSAIAWFALRPSPVIRFVEHRDYFYGEPNDRRLKRVAVFRISNETNSPFSYAGYDAASPFYTCQSLVNSTWQPMSLGWCGTGAGLHTVAPFTSVEFHADTALDGQATFFKVGIYFQRGTAAQVSAQPRHSVLDLFWQLYSNLNPKQQEPGATWSDAAPVDTKIVSKWPKKSE